jgi:hypothetical protein
MCRNPWPVLCLLLLPVSLTAGDLAGTVSLPSQPEAGSAYPPVVWLEGTESAGVPEIDTEITHIDGRLDPPISLGYVGREFVFRNDEDSFHNMHLYLHLDYQKKASQRPLHYGATLYNVPLPIRGAEISKPIKSYHRVREETGYIRVGCNPHPEEKAYVLVFDHPYCALVADDGSYVIEDIPPGRYPVRIFFQGEIRPFEEVEIHAEESTRLDLELN